MDLRGSSALVPGGITHDVENRSDAPATVLNVFPGAEWFAKIPPGHPR